MKNSPIVAIVGPTASGKTGLGVRIAHEFHGEVVSADSRAIYRGLDVGTAKPTLEERASVVHWGIDIANPGERFTVADFKNYADQKIKDILERGHLPIIVGGTGLYVDAVLYDYQFTSSSNNLELRKKLEQKSLEELYIYCEKNSIELPENYKNKRYVINKIIRCDDPPLKNNDKYRNRIIVGITTNKEALRKRIELRAKNIVNNTTINEAKNAAEKWGWGNEAMTGNVYPLIREYLEGLIKLSQLEEKFCTLDWRLAKRQMTWLKRNPEIIWKEREEAYKYLVQRLSEIEQM